MSNVANQLYKAIMRHTTWKKRFHNMIETGVIIEDDLSEENCEFGRWLKESKPELELYENYSTTVELHNKLHKEAKRIGALVLSGRRDAAYSAIAYGSEFERLSQSLVQHTIAWHDVVVGKK